MASHAEQTSSAARPCRRCGYDLTGLPESVLCPECGAGQSAKPLGRQRMGDALTSAPRAYVRRVGLGALVMGLGMGWTLVFVIGLVVSRSIRGSLWAALAFPAAATLCWCAGVFLLTAARPGVPGHEAESLGERIMRRCARWSQLAWLVAVASMVASAVPTPGAFAALLASDAVGLPGEIIAALGVPVLCWWLGDWAQWGRDEDLGEHLRLAACGLGGGAVIITLGTWLRGSLGPFDFPVLVLVVLSHIAVLLSLGTLAWSLVQLAFMGFWAIRNAATSEEIEQRLVARSREQARELEARTYRGPPPAVYEGGTIRTAAQDPPSGRALDPYPLEPS